MPGYLLDTNIVSDLINRPRGKAVQRLAQLREAGTKNIATSIIVAAELRYGAAKRGNRSLAQRVDGVLARLNVLPFAAPADAIYGRLRADLERQGLPLGGNDLLIAAQALAAGHTLVSDDRSFTRVPGLNCENWLVP